MSFLVALKFLTILPLMRKRVDTAEEFGKSVMYYPLAGLVIGLVLAGLNWLLSQILPAAVVSGIIIVSLVIITGALHLDGFIDTCDGIGGHKPPEARWEVMRDSRTGAFGVVGAVILLLMKYVLLSNVADPLLMPILLLMPVIGRWVMTYAIFAYPYARPSGLGGTIKKAATWQKFAVSTILTLAIAVGAAWLAGCDYFYLSGPGIMLVVWVIIVAAAAFFKKMFAGLTGDTYGALNEIAELTVLFLAVLILHNNWLL